MISRTESLIVRGQRKHVKWKRMLMPTPGKFVSASYLQHLCIMTPAERDKVLLNPSASTSTSVSGTATATVPTKNNVSHSRWPGVHILNQNALQGVLQTLLPPPLGCLSVWLCKQLSLVMFRPGWISHPFSLFGCLGRGRTVNHWKGADDLVWRQVPF